MQTTPERSDCTAGYDVQFEKQYSVNEFISEVLKCNEWGSIGIYDENQAWFDKGNPFCEYKQDKMITTLPESYLSKKIKKATASGGWSNMDYKLHLCD